MFFITSGVDSMIANLLMVTVFAAYSYRLVECFPYEPGDPRRERETEDLSTIKASSIEYCQYYIKFALISHSKLQIQTLR